MSDADARNIRLRRIAAGVLGVLAMVPLFFQLRSNIPWSAVLPMASPLVAAVLIQMYRLGPQLGARAIWWSNLVLGVILAVLGSAGEQKTSLPIVWGSGIALLLVGRTSVAGAAAHGGFAPSRFQSSLLVLMILALADAQMLLLFALLGAEDGGGRGSGWILLLVFALALFVGFGLLLRLVIAGVFLDVAVCLIALACLGTGVMRVDRDVQAPLAILLALHVLVAAPVVWSVLTKRSLPALSPRVAGRVGAGIVVTAMGLATLAGLLAQH